MITEILELIESNNNYNEVLVAGTTFTGTVLAIFFTLIALPIENILSKYSQELITRLKRDVIFIFSFIFLIITFSYNLFLIVFGSTPELTIVSLGLTIDSLLVLALLVIHTFYILDVRNQLNDTTKGIKGQIRDRIKKSEKRRNKEFEKMSKTLNLQ